jgi:predicted RNA binding protein YcfA (HicA-like mRNA interferase family)
MARLAGISGGQAVKAFVRAGYELVHQKGSHMKLRKAGQPTLIIPDHRELSPFLLRAQIRRAELTEEEFLGLL